MPIVGSTMRWGWVKCRACNSDKDHPYQKTLRAPGEIAERARLADAKAPYKPTPVADRSRLEELATTAAAAKPSAPQPDGRLDKLLDQVSKLTDAVAQLMEENRGLRASLANRPTPPLSYEEGKRIQEAQGTFQERIRKLGGTPATATATANVLEPAGEISRKLVKKARNGSKKCSTPET
jgi:DNA-binding ferritin-like protein